MTNNREKCNIILSKKWKINKKYLRNITNFDKMVMVKNTIINQEDVIMNNTIVKKESTKEFIKLKTEDKEKQKEIIITNIMHSMCIPANLKGYYYIRDAIKMVVNDVEYISEVTKMLYPEIAEKYKTLSSKVERAIRTAISITFERGNIEELSKYFDAKYFESDKKPKNSEFIANIAEKVKFEIE